VGFFAECPKTLTRHHMQRKTWPRVNPKGGQAPESSGWKIYSRNVEAPSPEDTKDPTSAKRTPTSPFNASSGHDTAHQFVGPKPTEHSEASLENPESFRLGAPGRRQSGEGSSVPRCRKQPCQYSCITESL
jgi:hypothetical protein